MRRDNVLEIEVGLTLETDDEEQSYMTWKGLRHGPKEVIDRLNRGETVDSASYYFRATPATGLTPPGQRREPCASTKVLTHEGAHRRCSGREK